MKYKQNTILMKNILKTVALLYVIFLGANYSQAQVFWTETFGSGCNAGTVADGFTSSNGAWQIDAPAAGNDADANVWYISAAENGEGDGSCSAGCGTNPTLHIGTKGIDDGANYTNTGAVTTDVKAISPVIDCSNKCGVELSFEYIENGDGLNDNLLVWYNDGATWSVLEDTPKTLIGACAPLGLWTSRTIVLPASSHNNPDVQIGFQWVNDNDGDGTNPSAAIYNIQMSANNNQTLAISCPSNQIENNGTSCDYEIVDFTALGTVTGNCGVPIITQTPAVGTMVSTGRHIIELTAEDNSGNTTSCSFVLTVYETELPVITCPSDTVTCDPVVTYSAPVAVDNCNGYTLTQVDGTGFTSGDVFPLGITNQRYEVVDSSGNLAACNFDVEVLEAPTTAVINTESGSFCDLKNINLEANPDLSGVGRWTVASGNADLSTHLINTTEASNLSPGLNTFVWSITSTSCGVSRDTVRIDVSEKPSQANSQDQLTVCNDTMVNIAATSPTVGMGAWSDVNGTALFLDSMAANTVLYNLSAGWNEIIWTVSNGVCPNSTDTLMVFKKAKVQIFTPDTTVCLLNDGFQLNATPIPNGVSGVWYSIDGGVEFDSQTIANPTITQIGGGENVIVYGQNHPLCGTTSDTIVVMGVQCKEFNPVIPTVFTPNNDGKNDLFIISDLKILYPDADVRIVNRWGNVVFESIGYEYPWNGTLRNEGKELPTGTYFYRILLNDNTNKEITGPISIIR